MDERPKLDAQLALACMLFLPPSMRSSRIVAMLTEAMRKPELARELKEHPREVFERRCGQVIPSDTSIEVHFSTANSIQLVLPLSSLSAQPGDAKPEIEITDEDLISEGLANARDLTAVAKTPPPDAYVKAGK
jgi:hypothetical protein